MKRVLLCALLSSCFVSIAEARKRPGRHFTHGYYRKDGTYVSSYHSGSGAVLSQSRGKRSSSTGRSSFTSVGETDDDFNSSPPALWGSKPKEVYPYYQSPTLEPSWVRQQRLERAMGITKKGKLAVSNRAATEFSFTGKCVAVLDGETIQVERNSKKETIRLYGVKAPKRGEPYDDKSLKSLSALALDQIVVVYPKSYSAKEPILGWVFVGKQGINAIQIKIGFARWDMQSAPSEEKLAQLESNAKSSRLGVWR